MLSKLAIVATAAFAIFASAAPLARRDSGDVLCCNSKTSSDSAQATQLYGLLGVVVQEIGIDCVPIAVLGSVCQSNQVTCDKSDFNDLVGVNCNNIAL